MYSQSALLAETFTANLTFERFLFRMNVPEKTNNFQSDSLCRSLSKVKHSLMIPKVVLTAKSFGANFARIRPFVGVRSLVNQQIIRLGEMSLAILADELLLRTLISSSNASCRTTGTATSTAGHFGAGLVRCGRCSVRRRERRHRQRNVRQLVSRRAEVIIILVIVGRGVRIGEI